MSELLRRITLPSGREIWVTRDYLIPESSAPPERLHECLACRSPLVQAPGKWEALPGGSFYLRLACPNCGYKRSGTFTQSEVDALDERLDQGLDDVRSDFRRLARANMSDDVERFAAALHAELILPEDF